MSAADRHRPPSSASRPRVEQEPAHREHRPPKSGPGGSALLAISQWPAGERPREKLLERGVRTDYRNTVLRFGPAPYLSDAQLVDAMEMLADVVG